MEILQSMWQKVKLLGSILLLTTFQDSLDMTIWQNVICKPAEHTYVFHEEYQIEEFRFTVLPTPGHSIGGVSLVFPDGHLVLTGDALFRETIGRTDLPTGSMEQLLHSVQTQLFTLPNYDVYPGHGPATTIAHEKTFIHFAKT